MRNSIPAVQVCDATMINRIPFARSIKNNLLCTIIISGTHHPALGRVQGCVRMRGLATIASHAVAIANACVLFTYAVTAMAGLAVTTTPVYVCFA